MVAREVDHGAFGERRDGEQRIGAERARDDGAVDHIQAFVHGGCAGIPSASYRITSTPSIRPFGAIDSLEATVCVQIVT